MSRFRRAAEHGPSTRRETSISVPGKRRDLKQEFEAIQQGMGPELLAFFSVPERRIEGLDPEDLAQMTLVRVYRSMVAFRQESTIRTWVLKIAVNVWSNALRDRKAEKRAGAEEISLDWKEGGDRDGRPVDPPDGRRDPQQELLDEERTRLLYEAIEALPDRMKRCFYLRYRDQLPIREIASVLRVEPSTVKSQLQEGRRRLGALLRDRFGVVDPTEGRGQP